MEPEFECLIGYQFRDRGLMEEALEEAGPETAGNERLALLGDTILSLMLLRRWYSEGNTTGRSAPAATDIVLIPCRARHESTSGLRLQ
jgi:dsRNA-specific ribonuclease